MNPRAKFGTVRGWDIGLAAAILAVVLLGWLTALGSNGAPPRSGQLVGRARPDSRAGPGGDVTGSFYVAPWPQRGCRPPSVRPAARPAPLMTCPALPRQ